MLTKKAMMAAIAAMLGEAGCSGCDDGTVGSNETYELALRTGPSCAAGCPVDRAMMVGTEEHIELRGDDIAYVTVDTANPSVAVAWIEDSTLCCTQGTCRVLEAAELCDELQTQTVRTAVVRALSRGETDLRVHARDGMVADSIRIRVAEPARLRAVAGTWVLHPDGENGAVPDDYSDPGPVSTLTIRMGTARVLSIEALEAGDRVLSATRGVGMRITNPEFAAIVRGPDLRYEGGAPSMALDSALIVPRAPGQTSIVLEAGGVSASVGLVVVPRIEAPIDVGVRIPSPVELPPGVAPNAVRGEEPGRIEIPIAPPHGI